MSNPPYIPIDCGFHDLLLEKATLKTVCTIRFYSEQGELTTTEAIIRDVYTRDKAEYMALSNGTVIRLDRILGVDNDLAPGQQKDGGLGCTF